MKNDNLNSMFNDTVKTIPPGRLQAIHWILSVLYGQEDQILLELLKEVNHERRPTIDELLEWVAETMSCYESSAFEQMILATPNNREIKVEPVTDPDEIVQIIRLRGAVKTALMLNKMLKDEADARCKLLSMRKEWIPESINRNVIDDLKRVRYDDGRCGVYEAVFVYVHWWNRERLEPPKKSKKQS